MANELEEPYSEFVDSIYREENEPVKEFNTTAVCIPSKHYMVDLSGRMKEIKKLIDAGKYFAINRARQYGKTTTLAALQRYLVPEYEVISLSFEGIGEAGFETEQSFVKAFCRKLKREYRNGLNIPESVRDQLEDFLSRKEEKAELDELFDALLDWCDESEKKIVLMIDEVDSASNNQVFLDFLSQLRDGYNSRNTKGVPFFQSVILAGVTDVKHLKNQIREDGRHRVNSPWNIAVDFNSDMSFSVRGIYGMLMEYESEHHTGMDAEEIANMIREYTEGYPYLVSRICQHLDEDLVPFKFSDPASAWSAEGVQESVKMILTEKSPLFESLTGKLTNYPRMKEVLYRILMTGESIPFNVDQEELSQLQMYGFIKNQNNTVAVSNRIFETRLYNLMLSEEELKSNDFSRQGSLEKNMFVSGGVLNMRLVLERFISTYTQIFGPLTNRFREKDGRELFLLYLKPIINGVGNYYIEAQTRDQTRMDVVVDYLGRQYIVELKIWRGERYNERGEQQILEYMNHFDLTTGYMLSFNFNQHKEQGVKRVMIGNRVLFEGML